VAGAAAGYLVLAIVLWWNVWTSHPTSVTVCGCGDAARFLWFLEWPSFALTHGHSPLYSQWLNHPTGINLLNDTSVLGLGVPLIPVTLAFGPVLSMNVALTLAPAASALAMFLLVRRFVDWTPVALVSGLAYGFSTFVLDPDANGQLNLAFLAIPPLIVLMLDEIIRRRGIRPVVAGVMLGSLCFIQFFLSVEVLLLVAFASLAAIIPIASAVRTDRRGESPGASRHIITAVITAAGVSLVTLAYPVWFYFAGRAHLTGSIWGPEANLWQWGTSPLSMVWPTGSPFSASIQRFFGGHSGPVLPSYSYLGIGFVALAILGLLTLRRDRVLQFFFGLGSIAAALSLSPASEAWVPWTALRHVPFLDNVAEYRFTVITLICLMVVVGRTLDAFHRWASARWEGRQTLVVGLATCLIAVLLLPNVLVLRSNLPLSALPVSLPKWFKVVGPNLPKGEVLLTYPPPFSGLQSSQAWQAVNKMRWSQAGVGGPAGTYARAGSTGPGFNFLLQSAYLMVPAPELISSRAQQVRFAIGQWGVTKVVVPDRSSLGFGTKARPTPWAIAFFTTILGAPPTRQVDAWVWEVPDRLPPVSHDLVLRFGICSKVTAVTPAEMLTCLSPGLTGS
jgi:hypothetical protein